MPVVTTSGTAAANLHPALLEAWHSQVPLVAVTADRPRTATFTGANQTTDQRGLFTPHVRGQITIDDRPGPGVDASGWWQFELARLLALATGSRSGQPGPVHLNVSFSEPLVPDVEDTPVPRELLIAPRVPAPEALPLDAGPQTVIVAGDLPPELGRSVTDLAARARVPLLAEPSSNARGGDAAIGLYRVLLGSALVDDVERVIMFGHPTLSRPVSRLLARDDIELVVVAHAAEWLDPGRRAHDVVDAVDLEPGNGDWLARWSEADHAVRGELDALLGALSYLSGPALAAGLWSTLAGRRHLGRRVLLADPRSRSGARLRFSAGRLRQPGTLRHRRHRLDRGRRRHRDRGRSACPARGRNLPARPDRADHRPVRAAAGPADHRGERQRRQHIRHPRARAAGAPGCLRTDLRHPPRRRGRRGGDGVGGHRPTGHECRRAPGVARRARRGVSR